MTSDWFAVNDSLWESVLLRTAPRGVLRNGLILNDEAMDAEEPERIAAQAGMIDSHDGIVITHCN